MKQLFVVLLMAWAAPVAAAQSAFLGVELDAKSELGALVVKVQSPSAASLMGLQAGDVIVGINEKRLDSSQALISSMTHFLPGEIVTLHVLRNLDELELPGILGRRPGDRVQAPPRPAQPGIPAPPAAPEFYYQIEPGLQLDWQPFSQLDSGWQYQYQFPTPSIPSPLWSGERPEWMGKEWGSDIQLNWQPYLDIEITDLQQQIDEQMQKLMEMDVEVAPQTDAPQVERTVKLRYPASTPQEERDALMQEAIEKYGPSVSVQFEGEGRSISIQTTQRGAAHGGQLPQPPQPPVPPQVDPDDEI